MPNTIVISGIIGLEVLPDDIRAQLKAFNGEPVDIEINSPGGLVVDGIEIFNLIRMYKGRVKARIMGLAGSMASIIPMAADEVEIFDNSVFFIHLALASIYGNKKMLLNEAEILDGFDRMLINVLVKKSGKSYEELEALMEKESFFFGSGIMDNGFADTMIESDTPADKSEVVANAKAQYYACVEKTRNIKEDFRKIAALIDTDIFSPPERPAFSNIQQGDKPMDLKKLKAEFPDVYQSAVDEGKKQGIEASKEIHIAEGKAAGILAERARIEQIEALAMPAEFTAKAKQEDWSPEKSAAEYLKAEAAKRKEIAANIEKDVSDPLESDVPVDAKAPEGPKDENPIETFNAEVAKLVSEGKREGEAMKIVKAAKPELHAAWVQAINQKDGGK